MKVRSKFNKVKEYPYLAIWTGGEALREKTVYEISNVVIISQVIINGKEEVQVQTLLGERPSWTTNKESEYASLPKGTVIEIEQ